jgi:hypothetical protein
MKESLQESQKLTGDAARETNISTPVVTTFAVKQNYNIMFYKDGHGEIGRLDFNGPELVFTGNASESAKVFFEWIAKSFSGRLAEERNAALTSLERESSSLKAQLAQSEKRAMEYVAINERQAIRFAECEAQLEGFRKGWQPMLTAPLDGTEIEILVRHPTYWLCLKSQAPVAAEQLWQQTVRGQWIDHNGGGWSWRGLAGSPVGWRAIDSALHHDT